MALEPIQSLMQGLGVVAGVMFVTWVWLRKMTAALDVIPGLLSGLEEAIRLAKAAHGRIDEHSRDTNDRFGAQAERLARMEARWDSHDREQDRREVELTSWLQRLEGKIDQLMERRG